MPSAYSAVPIATSSSRIESFTDCAGSCRSRSSAIWRLVAATARGPVAAASSRRVPLGSGERGVAVGLDAVPQSPFRCFSHGDDPAREQQVGGPSDADEAGQGPAHAVLGRQPEFRGGGGELGACRAEAKIAEQHQRQADAGARPVDRSNDRQSIAELPGEVGVETIAAARASDIGRQAGVVAALGRVTSQRLGVAAHTERRRSAGNDDCAQVGSVLEIGHHRPVFGVHPAGPRIVPVRAIEPHGGDRAVHGPPDRREVGVAHPQIAFSTPSANSGRQTKKSGSHGSTWL